MAGGKPPGYLQACPRIWTRDCREQIQLAVRAGLDLGAFELQIRRSNHSATLRLYIEWHFVPLIEGKVKINIVTLCNQISMNAQILEQTVATKKLYVTTLEGLTRVAVLMDTRVMVKAVQVNICIHP